MNRKLFLESVYGFPVTLAVRQFVGICPEGIHVQLVPYHLDLIQHLHIFCRRELSWLNPCDEMAQICLLRQVTFLAV